MIDPDVKGDNSTGVLKFKPPLIKTSSQNFSGDFGEIKTAREKLRAKRAKKNRVLGYLQGEIAQKWL